jgi:hypothetical protein
VFMHKPYWPRNISARFSTFNAESYLRCPIQPLEKFGFGHDTTYYMLDMLDMALMGCSVSECAVSQFAIAVGKITSYFNHL